LYELAQKTGGRILSFGDVEFIDLFDGSDVKVPKSPQPIWDLLAILAASILILDVAIRRLWIDKKSMQSMLAPVGKVSTGSVEALRKVHKPVTRTKVEKGASEKPVEELPKKSTPTKPKKDLEDRDDNLSQLLKQKRKRSGKDGES